MTSRTMTWSSLRSLSSPAITEEYLQPMNLLKLIVQSSIGPGGQLKLLRNTCGGHVAVTSSSQRLLSTIQFSNPFNQLVASAAITHLESNSNDGLYCILLSLELLTRMVRLEMQTPLTTTVCQKLGHGLINHVNECCFKLQVTFENVGLLMDLTESILKSKSACGLTEKQRRHLSCLLLRGFLNSVPQSEDIEERVGRFHFVSQNGLSPDFCQLLDGLLIETFDPTTVNTSCDFIKCVLFHISLAGDMETSLTDANWTAQEGISIVETCTKSILELCSQVVREGVLVVACQKVIHPRAKKYLAANGIITLDRLGQIPFLSLQELTGASPIESFIMPLDASSIGCINNINMIVINNKQYYHLQKQGSLVSTFFLCNYNEECISELKIVCNQAINALRSLLHSPYVLCGGGCLETHLAKFIRGWVTENMQELLKTRANEGQVIAIAEVFSKSFESIAIHLSREEQLVIDKESSHCWTAPVSLNSNNGVSRCACGLVSKSDAVSQDESLISLHHSHDVFEKWSESRIPLDTNTSLTVDAFWSKKEAIKTAIETVFTCIQVDCVLQKA